MPHATGMFRIWPRGLDRHHATLKGPSALPVADIREQLLDWSARSIYCRRGGGKDTPSGAPVGNADRAQGLGHRLRNSQAQTLPRRTD